MTGISKSFAYRLFQAIRTNKKALKAALPLYRPNSKYHVQNEMLRGLIDAMFTFEKFCRGAQPALADERKDKYFTLASKQQEARVHGHNCHMAFNIKASNLANRVLMRMVACQGLLRASIWQVFLSMEGTSASGFRDVVHGVLNTDQLPELVDRWRGRNPVGRRRGISVEFSEKGILSVEFAYDIRKVEQFFDVHIAEGKTVNEQLKVILDLCQSIVGFAGRVMVELLNWPVLSPEQPSEEHRAMEVNNINTLLAQFYDGLPWHRKALFRKHPDAAKEFFSNVR